MKLRDLVPFVTAELPQIPTATIELELCEAAREFCTMARVWSDELLPVPAQAGRTRYAFNVPEGAEVCQINSVWVGGREVAFLDPVSARAEVRAGSSSCFWWAPNFADLNLNPAPMPGAPIVVDAVMRPRFGAKSIPDEVAAGRERAISRGALAKLLAMPGKEWTDPGKAKDARDEFEAGYFAAGLDAASGGSADGLSVDTYDVRAR